MSPRTGRPTKLGQTKSIKVGFRLAPITVSKLGECADRLKKSRAEVVEIGIDEVFNSLDAKKKEDNE